MPDVVVIVRARVRAGREHEAEAALRQVLVPTHQEEGCRRYVLARGLDDPRTFVTVERWSSREAVERHMGSAHVQALLARVGPLLDAPPDFLYLETLSDDSERGRL